MPDVRTIAHYDHTVIVCKEKSFLYTRLIMASASEDPAEMRGPNVYMLYKLLT